MAYFCFFSKLHSFGDGRWVRKRSMTGNDCGWVPKIQHIRNLTKSKMNAKCHKYVQEFAS